MDITLKWHEKETQLNSTKVSLLFAASAPKEPIRHCSSSFVVDIGGSNLIFILEDVIWHIPHPWN